MTYLQRCAVLALLVAGCCLGLACGSGEDGDEDRPVTAADGPSPDLETTLATLEAADADGYCGLLSTRFTYDNYGTVGPEGLRKCREEGTDDPDVEIDAEVVGEMPARAVVKLDFKAEGESASLYAVLADDGEQWLIDGLSDSQKDLPTRTEAVEEGVTAPELERFLVSTNTAGRLAADCREVPGESFGEWQCDLTLTPPDGPAKGGVSLVTVSPNGTVTGFSVGGPGGIAGCCLDLRGG